ncbi:MAG TPA: agmatine deiminase family protein [Thermomicrobiales bacterium]|nr:agmatine deiminase family protein [Thermomicrobiales bacterium]
MTADSAGDDAGAASTPAFRMPAEWAPHERCLMAWPTRQELWGDEFEPAKAEYAAVARAIAKFEPVLMAALPAGAAEARRMCGPNVEVVEFPLDDSWLRDSGPIFVIGPNGERAGVDFKFNAWGERFHPFADDDLFPKRLLAHLGIVRRSSSMVLEGGSIAVDGEGTLIATEQCLLNPNRNPTWTREAIEGELRRQLGVETIVWLPFGIAEDSITDGHVDGVCAFVRPGVVLLQSVADRSDPNWERAAANGRRLDEARDAAGRRFEVIEAPYLPRVEVGGRSVRVPPVNFYVANGAVIAPVAGAATDEATLDLLAAAFPEREVVPVTARVIGYGGGGIHCITQQVPATERTDA